MIIAIFIFLLLFLWVLLGIKAVGPNEMGVYIFFGKPVCFINSGFAFIPLFPKSGLEKYPKTLFNLDYPAQKIITKAGEYREKGKGKKKNVRVKEYGKQLIEVDSVVYMRFPQFFQKPFSKALNEDNASLDEVDANAENMCIGLKRIVEQNIPKDGEGLKEWTRDTVASSLRNIFGEVTWVEATENLKDLRAKLKKHFRDNVNALTQAGFSSVDLDIEIQEVRLTKELEDLLQEPDKARLKSEAAVFTAQQQATEWMGMIIYGMSQITGKSLEQIQREIKKSQELQDIFRDYGMKLNRDLEMINRKGLFEFRMTGGSEGGYFKQVGPELLKFLFLLKSLPEGVIDNVFRSFGLGGEEIKKIKQQITEVDVEDKRKKNKDQKKEETKEERKERVMDWLKLKQKANVEKAGSPKEWTEWEKHKKKKK